MGLPPILAEDDSFVAFDKPSGALIAPDRWDKHRPYLMKEIHEKLGRDVATVHRLDADTSGVFLCAKTKPALDSLSGQFQSKTVAKKYLALAAILPPEKAMKVLTPLRDESGGLPKEFAADFALGPDEAHPGRMRLFKRRGGKASRTEFTVLEVFGRFAWLECRPVTGRTHQIRIHLAALGAPVLNDPFYGDPDATLLLSELKRRYKGREKEKPLIGRLALHAHELTFKHPATGESVTVRSETPREFEVALKYLRRYAAHTPARG